MKDTNAPWSIRGAMRKFSTEEINLDDPKMFRKILTDDGRRKPRLSEIAALEAWKKAAKGDLRATELLADSIEGKLTQPTDVKAAIDSNVKHSVSTDDKAILEKYLNQSKRE